MIKKSRIFFILLILILTPTLALAELSTFDNSATIFDSDNLIVWTPTPFLPRDFTTATSFASTYTFASHENWRLPTKSELESIIDTTKTPKISPLFNLGPIRNWSCWSSTTYTDLKPHAIFPNQAYIISFSNGKKSHVPLKSHYSFLLVSDFTDEIYFVDVDFNYLIDSDGLYLTGASE
jgi:hypothetical protein